MNADRECARGRTRRLAETLLLCAVLAIYACVIPLYAAGLRAEEAASDAMAAQAPDIAYETLRRDELRESAIESLAALATSETVSERQRALAQEQLLRRLEWAEMEATIEEELTARGMGGCVASLATSFASVITAFSPSAAQVAAICEAVERVSGISGGDIRVIPLA